MHWYKGTTFDLKASLAFLSTSMRSENYEN